MGVLLPDHTCIKIITSKFRCDSASESEKPICISSDTEPNPPATPVAPDSDIS